MTLFFWFTLAALIEPIFWSRQLFSAKNKQQTNKKLWKPTQPVLAVKVGQLLAGEYSGAFNSIKQFSQELVETKNRDKRKVNHQVNTTQMNMSSVNDWSRWLPLSLKTTHMTDGTCPQGLNRFQPTHVDQHATLVGFLLCDFEMNEHGGSCGNFLVYNKNISLKCVSTIF